MLRGKKTDVDPVIGYTNFQHLVDSLDQQSFLHHIKLKKSFKKPCRP